jgi:hypothetical protein
VVHSALQKVASDPIAIAPWLTLLPHQLAIEIATAKGDRSERTATSTPNADDGQAIAVSSRTIPAIRWWSSDGALIHSKGSEADLTDQIGDQHQ